VFAGESAGSPLISFAPAGKMEPFFNDREPIVRAVVGGSAVYQA